MGWEAAKKGCMEPAGAGGLEWGAVGDQDSFHEPGPYWGRARPRGCTLLPKGPWRPGP